MLYFFFSPEERTHGCNRIDNDAVRKGSSDIGSSPSRHREVQTREVRPATLPSGFPRAGPPHVDLSHVRGPQDEDRRGTAGGRQ